MILQSNRLLLNERGNKPLYEISHLIAISVELVPQKSVRREKKDELQK